VAVLKCGAAAATSCYVKHSLSQYKAPLKDNGQSMIFDDSLRLSIVPYYIGDGKHSIGTQWKRFSKYDFFSLVHISLK
jgi:hypothetical protein